MVLFCAAYFQSHSSFALDSDKKIKVQVPEGWGQKGAKLKIKNTKTGATAIVSLGDENFLSSEAAQSVLSAALASHGVPQFSYQSQSTQEEAAKILNEETLLRAEKALNTSSPLVDQNVWKSLKYQSFQLSTGETRYRLEMDLQKDQSPLEAARKRQGLREEALIRKLFEIAWRALQLKRHDVAEDSFNRILKHESVLGVAEKYQASLGRGIARFHQKGCAPSESDFEVAAHDEKNLDDVSYFKALCLMEKGDKLSALPLFEGLVKKLHPAYGEASRFYLGVIKEDEKKWDDAEAAYQDTLDFSNDPRLQSLAQERLQGMHEKRKNKTWDRLGASFTLGSGYDTNVISLPQELSPSDQHLSQVHSFSLLGMAALDAKVLSAKRFENHLRYSYLFLHFLDAELSPANDIQSQGLATTLDYSLNKSNNLALALAYDWIFKGELGLSREYIDSPSAEFKWAHIFGDGAQPKARLGTSFKFARINEKDNPSSAAKDVTANSYKVSTRYLRNTDNHQSWGPALELEYHPSAGIENSYYSAGLLGNWDLPLGPQSWGLKCSQEGAIQYIPYYESSSNRKDYMLRYRAALSKDFMKNYELRLQGTAFMNFSTDKANYQYTRLQLSLLVAASF